MSSLNGVFFFALHEDTFLRISGFCACWTGGTAYWLNWQGQAKVTFLVPDLVAVLVTKKVPTIFESLAEPAFDLDDS